MEKRHKTLEARHNKAGQEEKHRLDGTRLDGRLYMANSGNQHTNDEGRNGKEEPNDGDEAATGTLPQVLG